MNNHIQPGMVVIARVFNPFENPSSTGKRRPYIVTRCQDGQVLLVGLTTTPGRHDVDTRGTNP